MFLFIIPLYECMTLILCWYGANVVHKTSWDMICIICKKPVTFGLLLLFRHYFILFYVYSLLTSTCTCLHSTKTEYNKSYNKIYTQHIMQVMYCKSKVVLCTCEGITFVSEFWSYILFKNWKNKVHLSNNGWKWTKACFSTSNENHNGFKMSFVRFKRLVNNWGLKTVLLWIRCQSQRRLRAHYWSVSFQEKKSQDFELGYNLF